MGSETTTPTLEQMLGRRISGDAPEPNIGYPSEEPGMSEGIRCVRCGAGLKFIGERVVGPDHVHREYECSGCLHQSSACSAEDFKLVQHVHR